MFKYTFLLVLLFAGCVNTQIGFFEVSPYARVTSNKIDQPLYVKYSSRVNDTHLVKEPGFTIQTSELHRSYLFATQRAFGDLFSDVILFMPSDVGFILEIQQMEPKWSFHDKQKINQFKDTFNYTEAWCTMQYASSIYRNDLLVSQSTGNVTVKQEEIATYKPEGIFKEAVKRSIAQMAQDHYNKR
jgi:hypothetical protein